MKNENFKTCLATESVLNCSLALVLIKSHKEDQNTKCPLAIRYTIDRKSRYHKLGESFTEDEFSDICNAKRSKSNLYTKQKDLTALFVDYVKKVRSISETALTLDQIKERLTKKSTTNFIEVWEDVINSKNEGTAASYVTAKKSFEKHTTNLVGFQIGESDIHNWVQGMVNDGISRTTIGIYLRACRVVWNECTRLGHIESSNYPFGKGKVEIPTGNTRKSEFLTVEQMTELYHVFTEKRYNPKWGEDYTKKVHVSLGLFLAQYLCNGFNLSDAARIKYEDYYFTSGKKTLQFYRQKTRERSESSEVIIPIIEPLQKILDEIAAPVERGEYVFPFIFNGAVTEEDRRKRIAQENSNIQDRVIKVCEWLEWDVKPSGTWCRHSFATNLSRCGVPKEYISESMGHSYGGSVTQRYIARYPLEKQIEYNNLLLNLGTNETTSEVDALKAEIERLKALLAIK